MRWLYGVTPTILVLLLGACATTDVSKTFTTPDTDRIRLSTVNYDRVRSEHYTFEFSDEGIHYISIYNTRTDDISTVYSIAYDEDGRVERINLGGTRKDASLLARFNYDDPIEFTISSNEELRSSVIIESGNIALTLGEQVTTADNDAIAYQSVAVDVMNHEIVYTIIPFHNRFFIKQNEHTIYVDDEVQSSLEAYVVETTVSDAGRLERSYWISDQFVGRTSLARAGDRYIYSIFNQEETLLYQAFIGVQAMGGTRNFRIEAY